MGRNVEVVGYLGKRGGRRDYGYRTAQDKRPL